jgi:hypothetical protein
MDSITGRNQDIHAKEFHLGIHRLAGPEHLAILAARMES